MDNLLETIHEYLEGFVVTREDFTAPRPEFIIEFFFRVLQEFEADLDHVRKYNMMGDCVLDDMCSLNVEILNLCNIINYILPALNLGLFDILTPTPKRTFELVSKTIDFIALADNIMGDLNAKMTQSAYEKQQIIIQHSENEELRAEVNAMATEKHELEQRGLMLARDLDKLKQECEELTIDDRECRYQMEKMANVYEKLASEQEDHRIKLETLRATIESLSGDVLGNPEFYFEKIKVLEQQKASAGAAVAESEKKLNEKSERKKLFLNDCEAMEETCKQFDALQEYLKKYKEKTQQLSLNNPTGLQTAIDALNDEIKSILNENKAIERNLLAIKDKKQTLLTKKELNEQRMTLKHIQTQIDTVAKQIEDLKHDFLQNSNEYTAICSTLKKKCKEAWIYI